MDYVAAFEATVFIAGVITFFAFLGLFPATMSLIVGGLSFVIFVCYCWYQVYDAFKRRQP